MLREGLWVYVLVFSFFFFMATGLDPYTQETGRNKTCKVFLCALLKHSSQSSFLEQRT